MLAASLVLRFNCPTSARLLIIVFGLAILYRALLVFAPPTLSDDVYRYVWDGRVQANQINPYAYAPDAPELSPLRDEVIWPFGAFDLITQNLLPQVGQTLGERLDNALAQCLNDGFYQVIVMGSDSPTLPVADLSRAFELLCHSDLILGPCDDGGYFLIGLTQPRPYLLRQVEMSTESVLRDTLRLAEEAELSVVLLPAWYDVDTFGDLQRVRIEFRSRRDGHGRHTRRFLLKTQLDTRDPLHLPDLL